MAEKAVVSIARGTDMLATARQCVGHSLADIIRPGDRVLIKVNQVGGFSIERGCTVHPDLVGEVVEMAREAGASEVGIADDVGRLLDTMQVFESLGTLKVAQRVGARVVDLQQEPHPRRPVPGPLLWDEIEYSAPLLEWDRLIGLTKLKTHHQGGITGAMKNLFGAVPHHVKSRAHRTDLDKTLVDINSVRHCDYTIVDGFPAHEGLGPHLGLPVPMNLTLAGADPVAVDAVAAAVMGFQPGWVRHVSMAGEKGLGVADLDRIEVQGVPIAQVARRFLTPLEHLGQQLSGYVQFVDRAKCNGCPAAVATIFMCLLRGDVGPEQFRGLKFYLGDVGPVPDADDPGVFLVGDCVQGYEGHPRFLPGCPPTVPATMQAVSPANMELVSFGSARE